MSKQYDEFKAETIKADTVIADAEKMRVVSLEYADAFHKAMWEAREIYMRLEAEQVT